MGIDPARCGEMLVVVLGHVVNPSRKLERFVVFQPKNCEGKPVDFTLSREWKVSACMAHSLSRLTPTYRVGEPPRTLYFWHIYDLQRPHRIIPRQGAGTAIDNPVVLIDETLPALVDGKDPTHVCAGNLDAPPLEEDGRR